MWMYALSLTNPSFAAIHPQAPRIMLACYLVLASWVEGGILMVILITGLVTKSSALTTPFMGTLFILLLTIAVYIAVALTLQCTTCKRRFLFETSGAKHALARKRGNLDHWATGILDGLFRHRMTCMYCGTEHLLRRNGSHNEAG